MHCHCATAKSLCLFRQNIRLQPNLNPPNALSLCHCKVTVSLKIHLNQFSPNGYPNMPMDCQFANAMSFEPLMCHCKVNGSLKIHLNQFSPNRYQFMPMDYQFVNAMPLDPLLCHFNHWDNNQNYLPPRLHSTA